MNAEIIGYRCSRAEWETMRLLLGLAEPIGLPEMTLTEDACRAAYDSLCDCGVLTPSDDEVVVDRLFALLLTEAGRADACLLIRAQDRQVLLHRTPHMVLLSEWTSPQCTLTPLPDTAAAKEPLLDALKRCAAPMDMELLAAWGTERAISCETPELAQAELETLYNAFYANTLDHREV